MTDITVVSNLRCRVGESPVWDATHRALLWCDTRAGLIHALNTVTGDMCSHELPDQVGSFGLADDGRLVVALAGDVCLYDLTIQRLTRLAVPEPGHASRHPGDRLNDGKIGPDGAFWVGSIHKTGPTAALYRIDGAGVVETKVSGLWTSNGLAFSADGRTLFHSDSRLGWIDRHDLDVETGRLSNRVRLVTQTESDGRPDGGATDLAGRYWSAGVSAGCLNCFDRDGALLNKIHLPLKRPTMVCFGGEDMRTLYVTSIRSPEDASEHCGRLLSLRTEVPGVPVHAFRVSR